MATNGQLLARALRQEKLLESEIQQLETALDGYDTFSGAVKGVYKTNGVWRFDRLEAGFADFDIPPTRAVVYTGITNGVIPSGTETTLAFGTSRGYIKQKDGCMVQMPGSTTKFTKPADVPRKRDVFVFGDVTWDTKALGIRDVYVNYFDVDNTPLGAFTVSVTPSSGNWATAIIAYDDFIDMGQYITLSVYQDSGGPITLQDANLGFALI